MLPRHAAVPSREKPSAAKAPCAAFSHVPLANSRQGAFQEETSVKRKPVSATGTYGSAGVTPVCQYCNRPHKGWGHDRTCLNAPKKPHSQALLFPCSGVTDVLQMWKGGNICSGLNPLTTQLQSGIPRQIRRPEKIDGIRWTNYSALCKATWLSCLLAKVEHRAMREAYQLARMRDISKILYSLSVSWIKPGSRN